jgi:hypothetical protein
MTGIQHFIGRIRNHYLTGLCREIAVYHQTFNQSLSEALIELEGLDPLPQVFHLHRVDMSSNSSTHTDFTEFKSQDSIYFRPTKLSLNNEMKISLEPFMWNEVDIECTAFDSFAPLLQKWAHYWLHDYQHRDNEYGLTGCAHGLSFPRRTGDICHFTVDFGSADVRCFVELMQILHHLGVRRARIYSKALYQ